MSNYKCFRAETLSSATLLHLADPDAMGRIVITELRDELARLLEEQNPQRLVVSFSAIRHCSSEMIAGLVAARNALKKRGGEMRLCAMKPEVREVFQVTNLDGRIFDIYETLDDALGDD